MKATDQLKEEHQGVILALSILEEIAKRLQAKKDIDLNHLKKLLEFLQVFVDKCHHGKEEDVLFPAMEKAGVPKEGGPIGMMLLEHDMGRSYIKGLSQAIGKYATGDLKASQQIIENAEKYIALLREHIEKENNILYEIADMHLSPKQQRDIPKQFDKIENEKIGKGKHEQFHQMLNDLSKQYLKN